MLLQLLPPMSAEECYCKAPAGLAELAAWRANSWNSAAYKEACQGGAAWWLLGAMKFVVFSSNSLLYEGLD